MTIRRYEIAGLEVEVRMADGMESLIPAQFEVFRVGEDREGESGELESLESLEGRASISVGGSENRDPDQSSARPMG